MPPLLPQQLVHHHVVKYFICTAHKNINDVVNTLSDLMLLFYPPTVTVQQHYSDVHALRIGSRA